MLVAPVRLSKPEFCTSQQPPLALVHTEVRASRHRYISRSRQSKPRPAVVEYRTTSIVRDVVDVDFFWLLSVRHGIRYAYPPPTARTFVPDAVTLRGSVLVCLEHGLPSPPVPPDRREVRAPLPRCTVQRNKLAQANSTGNLQGTKMPPHLLGHSGGTKRPNALGGGDAWVLCA